MTKNFSKSINVLGVIFFSNIFEGLKHVLIMSQNDPPNMKKLKIDLNLWLYGRLKMWADENGMSVRAAVRYIINQFFKSKI